MPKPRKVSVIPQYEQTTRPNQLALRAETAKSSPIDHDTALRQFDLELSWCIEQLERFAANKKNEKEEISDTKQALAILKNEDQPIIFKKLLMRTFCGDYAVKMAAAGRVLAKTSKSKAVPGQTKTFLLRKAALEVGDGKGCPQEKPYRRTPSISSKPKSSKTPSKCHKCTTKSSVTTANSSSSSRSSNSKSSASFSCLMDAAAESLVIQGYKDI